MKRTILFMILLIISLSILSQGLVEVGSWEYGPTEAVAVKDSTAYISSGKYLWVLDISDESNPTFVSEMKLANYINYIRTIGNYLYVSKEDSILNIYDINAPHTPTLANQIQGDNDYPWQDIFIEQDSIIIGASHGKQYYINDTLDPQYVREMGLCDQMRKKGTLLVGLDLRYLDVYDASSSGNVTAPSDYFNSEEDMRGLTISTSSSYSYFGYGSRGIGVVDITDINNISLHSTINTGGYTYDIEVIEDTLMIAARGINGIGVYDMDNDTTFTLVGECDTDGYAYELEIIGDRLYVGARSGGLVIIDISDITNPTVLGEYRGYGECRRFDIDGDRLYTASGDGGLMIMDISNRTSPTVISQCYSRDIAEDAVKSGNYVYIADGDSGLTVIDITDENNPILLSGLASGNYAQYADIYNNNCIIGGRYPDNSGVAFFDVTTQSTPSLVSEIYQEHHYISFIAVDSILHIISTAAPTTRYTLWNISDVYSADITDSNKIHLGSYRNLAASADLSVGNYLDSIFIYDVSNPTNISNINKFNLGNYADAMYIFNDMLYVTTDEPLLQIFNLNSLPALDTVLLTSIKERSRDIRLTPNYLYLSHDEFGITIWGENTGILDNRMPPERNTNITTTLNTIQIENTSNNTYTYQITDITGRIIKNIEAKKGITKYTPKRSGIYFVVDKKNGILGKAIIIK